MTVTTLTTVGFREIHDLSQTGTVFTIVVIVAGVGGMLYTLTTIIAYVVEVQFPILARRRQMSQQLSALRDHYVLCGYGRVGRFVALELKREQAPLVVVEVDEQAAQRCEEEGHICLRGDATIDDVLRSARIESARGLITALDTDERNLYVVLSARELNPEIHIVARASTAAAEVKLRRVGANRVLSPSSAAGRRMAVLAMKPLVADFLDTVTQSENLELLLEEIAIPKASALAGQTIGELDVGGKTGVIILAIHHPGSELEVAPKGDAEIRAGDTLVVLGTSSQLQQLEKLR
jgi:voltage-gated potassium channel